MTKRTVAKVEGHGVLLSGHGKEVLFVKDSELIDEIVRQLLQDDSRMVKFYSDPHDIRIYHDFWIELSITVEEKTVNDIPS